MKNLVLSRKQLEKVTTRLNEYQDTTTVTLIPDEGDERSAAGVARTIQKNKQDIDRTTQTMGGKVNIKVAGDNTDLAPVNAQVPENGSVSQAADNLSQDQGAGRLLSQGASTIFTNEGKSYTKKQLEEIRINNIKKNSVVKTKKQLEEEFNRDLSNVDDSSQLNVVEKQDFLLELLRDNYEEMCKGNDYVDVESLIRYNPRFTGSHPLSYYFDKNSQQFVFKTPNGIISYEEAKQKYPRFLKQLYSYLNDRSNPSSYGFYKRNGYFM